MRDQRPDYKPQVLLVDDDVATASLLQRVLQSNRYAVSHVRSGRDARQMLRHRRPDLVILDLILPDEDGLLLLAHIAAMEVSVLVCTAGRGKRDRVLSLKLGADDYVSKPFDSDELEARAEAILRRARRQTREADSEPIRVGELVIDPSQRLVTLGGRVVHVTTIEYGILTALALRPLEVVTRRELAVRVWGDEGPGMRRVVDAHVCRLRAKLSAGASGGPAITSVRGFGYVLRTA